MLAFAGELSGQKRSRGEEEPAAWGARSSQDDSEHEEQRRAREEEEDDDDDDVDLSSYHLGEEDEPKEDVAYSSAPPYVETRPDMAGQRDTSG